MFKYVILELFCRKGRRKDKDSPTPPAQEESKRYLEDTCIKERVTDADFFRLVSLPQSLDYNEWLATHGTDSKQSFPKKWGLIARHFVSLFFGGGGKFCLMPKVWQSFLWNFFNEYCNYLGICCQTFTDLDWSTEWENLLDITLLPIIRQLGFGNAATFFTLIKKKQNCNWYVSCRHNFVYLLNRI